MISNFLCVYRLYNFNQQILQMNAAKLSSGDGQWALRWQVAKSCETKCLAAVKRVSVSVMSVWSFFTSGCIWHHRLWLAEPLRLSLLCNCHWFQVHAGPSEGDCGRSETKINLSSFIPRHHGNRQAHTLRHAPRLLIQIRPHPHSVMSLVQDKSYWLFRRRQWWRGGGVT